MTILSPDIRPAPALPPRERIARAAAVLCDLDGCLAAGNALLPGALDLATLAGERLVVLSNNSTHLPTDLAALLARQGLPVPTDRIVLAGAAAVELIACEAPGAAVMLLASPALRAFAGDLALWLTDDPAEAEIVLLCRDLDFSFAALARAAEALHRGARLVATNPDLTHPGAAGLPVPETGALLAALLACAPHVAPRVIGKPEPDLFRLALRRLGADAGDAVMIGDNPTTDGAGAARLGIPALLIGSAPEAVAPGLAALLSRKV